MLIFGIFFLKGTNIFGTNQEYFAVYDNIDGLAPSSPITINGFRIGQVKSIQMMPNGSGYLLVVLQISEEGIDIPWNSKACIYSSDILGSKAVELQLGDTMVMKSPGDTLIACREDDLKTEVNRQIAPLKAKTEELISSIDSAVTIVQEILNKDARENLSASFEGIKRAINTFEQTAIKLDTMIAAERAKISSIFTNVQNISSNLADNNAKLTNIINNFSDISDSIAAADLTTTIHNTRDAMEEMEQIMAKINNGEGSLGLLVNNDSLYNNLVQTSEDMDALVEDLRVNPHRYLHFSVFGRQPKTDLNLSKKEKEKLKELLK